MLEAIGRDAREAANALAQVSDGVKSAALIVAADSLERSKAEILAANGQDLDSGLSQGLSPTLIDRLTLTEERLAAMAASLRTVAKLPDPIGEVMTGWKRPNGLEIRQVRVPLGVIAVIYEARPNVTSDVIGLCLKSGNAVILRGSGAAARSNKSIMRAVNAALSAAGLPEHSAQLILDSSREAARALMRMRGSVDLLIPRGGRNLIAEIIAHATVPYVIDGDGNCHIYVDESADVVKAVNIVVNAKVSRPSVCNSAEKLLIHRRIAPEFLARIAWALMDEGVELRGDEQARKFVPEIAAATEEDWSTEYLGLVMAIRIVADVDEAIDHIRRFTSGHSEAIVAQDVSVARRFVAGCPSAVVMVNASTRFTDGGEFGFGAEIGNSTQRLHARGPMGVRELTTYRYEVWGDGQIRA